LKKLPTDAMKRRKPTRPTATEPCERNASTASAVTYPHSARVIPAKATTNQVRDRLSNRIRNGSTRRPNPATGSYLRDTSPTAADIASALFR